MNTVIRIGQVLFTFIWLILLANLVVPFPESGFALLLLLLGLLIILHLLQMLIFYTAFHQQVQPTGKDYGFIFLFGVIGWMMALKRHHNGSLNP